MIMATRNFEHYFILCIMSVKQSGAKWWQADRKGCQSTNVTKFVSLSTMIVSTIQQARYAQWWEWSWSPLISLNCDARIFVDEVRTFIEGIRKAGVSYRFQLPQPVTFTATQIISSSRKWKLEWVSSVHWSLILHLMLIFSGSINVFFLPLWILFMNKHKHYDDKAELNWNTLSKTELDYHEVNNKKRRLQMMTDWFRLSSMRECVENYDVVHLKPGSQ